MNAVVQDDQQPSGDASLLLVCGAIITLGYVLQWSHGHYLAGALYLTIGAWLAVLAALAVRFSFRPRVVELVLGLGMIEQLYMQMVTLPTVEMSAARASSDLLNFFLGLAAIGVLFGAGLSEDKHVRRWWFPAVVVVHFLMGALVLKLAPSPQIDTFTIENESLSALMQGINPFGITLTNPYGDNTPFFPPGTSVNGRLQFGFPYPPLTLLLCVPGWVLAHDPRYSFLGAISIAALCMGYARPGNLGKLVGAVFLFTPRVFFVVDRAWTDPFVVMLTALVVFTALRKPRWLFIPLGLLACLKQQMVIGMPAVFLLLPRPLVWRDVWTLAWKSIAVGLAVTVPFVLWSPSAFANSVLVLKEVYRLDCLTIIAHLANTGVVRLSKWSGLAVIVPVIAVGLWRAPRTATGFALLVGATHFSLYLFSTHGFCNEYFNVLGALCVAAAAWAPAPATAAK